MHIAQRILESEALTELAVRLHLEAAQLANEWFIVHTEWAIPADDRARGYRWPLNLGLPGEEEPDAPGTVHYYHARATLCFRPSWEYRGRQRRKQAFALVCYIDGATGHGYLGRHCYLYGTIEAALHQLNTLHLPADNRWGVVARDQLDHYLASVDQWPFYNSDSFEQNLAARVGQKGEQHGNDH